MLDDNSDLVASTSEILRDRLYFIAFKKNHKPKNTTQVHYFCVDDDYVYENFYNDFGPLNVCMLYHYCQKLLTKLTVKCHTGKRIVHYTSMNSAKRLNAAYLIGSYAIIYLHKTPDEVYRRLTAGETPAYTRFCDASYGPSNFKISLIDCLNAIYKALRAGFFNFNDFDVGEYEFYERVENGDLNWIVPQKFIAFCGPHQLSKTLPNGYPCHSPQTYFEYFRVNNVTTIIRLNAKVYHASTFENAGFDHKDLFFVDGSTPSDQILKKFLAICEITKGAIAVHCKAGLGRTGSLIGAYIMKHYNFSALEAIAWLRLCRPGSVIGHQQQWMEDKQAWLWSEGERIRERSKLGTPVHLYGIYSVALKKKMDDDLANDNPEPLPPLLKGISQRVDTMHLNDGEDTMVLAMNTPPQFRIERQNSRGSSNRKTRARSLATVGQHRESSNYGNANSNGGSGGLSSLSTSGGSDYEDVVDGEAVHKARTRRRKSPHLNAGNTVLDVETSVLTPSFRKAAALEQQGNGTAGRLTTEPLYSEKKLKKPSLAAEANSSSVGNSATTTHNKHTIASSVKMTQAAIDRQNAQTQGDKLNQIKAMRRHHISRATLASSAAADVEGPIRHTRARSQQPFRNNNNIVNMLANKQLISTNNAANSAECTNNNNHNNAINTSDQLNNNITTGTTITATNNNNNNNNSHANFTSAMTTRARSLAIYSKRIGLMHLRKGDAQQEQQQQPQQPHPKGPNETAVIGHLHHDVTTPTLSSLGKQTKTYNNTLLGSTVETAAATASYNDSKIPVVRATAALIDMGGAVCRVATVPDASATIPPTRSRAGPSHHYTLRGRSRIRYHNRSLLATTATTTSALPGRSSCRDLPAATAVATVSNGMSTRSSTVAAAVLDLNSNPLDEEDLEPRSMAAADKSANNNQHQHHRHNQHHQHNQQQSAVSSSACELNNNFSCATPPPLPLPQSCGFEATTTTNGLQSQLRVFSSTTGIPVHQHHNHYGSGTQQQPTTATATSMKRNKRSLSNARIEKEKCDEYNTKLLRKTRITTTTNASVSATATANTSNGNGIVLATTGNSSSGSVGGGSFRRRRQIPTATVASSAATAAASSSSSTAPAALIVLDSSNTAVKDQQQHCEEQQQRLLLKLRKKVSY